MIPIPRQHRIVRSLVALLCLLPLGLAAAGPPEAANHPLSLQECLKIAVENNPNAAAFLHAGRAAMARVGSSRSAYWPTLSLSGDLSRSYAEQSAGPPSRSAASSAYTSSSAALQGQYTLLDSGERKATVSASRASYLAADAAFKANVQDLALAVESAYYALEGDQWRLDVARETKKQTLFHLNTAQAQQNVGLVPYSDVLQAATADANAGLGVIQSESAVTSDRAALSVLMGFPADTGLQIEEIPSDSPLPTLPDWEAGRDRALKLLPEVQAAFQNTQALTFSLKAAEAAYRPTITADGAYGRQDAGSWPNLETWSVGLTLHIPLFTGYAKTYQVIQAREALSGSEMDLKSTKLSSEKTAYDARTQFATALQSVVAAKALVESAQENSDVAEGRYKQGLGSMLDVVDATTALQNARLQLISARLSLLTAQAGWDRATGKDLLNGLSLPSTASISNKPGAEEGRMPAPVNGESRP